MAKSKATSGKSKGASKGASKTAAKAAPAKPVKPAPVSEQLSLDAQAPQAEAVYVPASEPPPRAVPPSERVTELVIGANGTWKKLGNGKTVQIDDQEWLLELGRMLARKPQADPNSDQK